MGIAETQAEKQRRAAEIRENFMLIVVEKRSARATSA